MDDRSVPRPGPSATPVVLADGRRTGASGPVSRGRVWLRFGLATALALAVVLAAGMALSERAAQREGVADVRRITEVLASAVIQPQLSAGLLAGQSDRVTAMDDVVQQRLLVPTDIVRVKIWSADGRIVYSDAQSLIGARYPLGDEEVRVLRDGGTHAEVSDLSLPENRLERALGGRLLEVYAGIRAPDGTPLLFEAYFSFESVNARRSVLLRSFASITLAGLFVFAGFQLSLGYTTVRWLHRERERLLEKAMKMSEGHRKRLASDLHDGIVQDLVGASFLVAGASAELGRGGDQGLAAALGEPSRGIRASIQRLRSMIVDLYPAALQTAGLEVALSDLAAPLRLRGIDVQLQTPAELNLPEHSQTVIYRMVQEALRSILRHASAHQVTLTVHSDDSTTVVEIAFDGVGYLVGEESSAEHLGLLAMADLAREAEALLEVVSEPGHGTILRLRLRLPT
jgi:signal transduction histidine kinase